MIGLSEWSLTGAQSTSLPVPCFLPVCPHCPPAMPCVNIDCALVSVGLANLLLLGAGLGLVLCGGLLLEDTETMLISRLLLPMLPQPLFYYAALALMLLGLSLTALSVLGCWSAHLNNYWVLSFHLFSLLVLLVAECVAGVVAVLCPQYLGLSLDREALRDNWQRTYGVPGREQFTAAIDLVQTKMQCCGVESSGDWTASWWRLRELAPEGLIVPLSCCIQQQPASFLDPRPINATLCEHDSVDSYRLARHIQGCCFPLSAWLRQLTPLCLATALALLALELLVLLLTILSCVKRSSSPPPLPPKLIDKVHNSFPYSGS